MKYGLLFLLLIGVPQSVSAQFVESFTIEAQIIDESGSSTTTPTTTPASAGGAANATRVDRTPADAGVQQPVPNVRNVHAVTRNNEVLFTWTNPVVDFAAIRVIKDDFYAKDPYDGWLIYNSRGEQLYDAVPDEAGTFYTFFVVMPDGRASSGVTVFYQQPPLLPQPSPQTEPVESVDPGATSEIDVAPELPNVIYDETFWQQIVLLGAQQVAHEHSITDRFPAMFSAAEDISFSIPAYVLPTDIRSVVLAIENKFTSTEEYFFMQRENSTLVAEVPRRLVAGEYRVQIVLYDFANHELARQSRVMDVYPHYFVEPSPTSATQVIITDYIFVVYVLCAVFFLLLLWRALMVIKRG